MTLAWGYCSMGPMQINVTKKPPRTFKIGIRVTAAELERIRIAAAKQGLRASAFVYRAAVDAALRAA